MAKVMHKNDEKMLLPKLNWWRHRPYCITHRTMSATLPSSLYTLDGIRWKDQIQYGFSTLSTQKLRSNIVS